MIEFCGATLYLEQNLDTGNFKSAVTDLPVRDHIPPHLQLRERAQVTCPRRVGFELGPSHKTVAAFGVCRAYRFNHWDQGSSTPFYFLDISYSDWNTDQGSVVEEASLPGFESIDIYILCIYIYAWILCHLKSDFDSTVGCCPQDEPSRTIPLPGHWRSLEGRRLLSHARGA